MTSPSLPPDEPAQAPEAAASPAPARAPYRRVLAAALFAVLGAVILTYSNHFHNSFHFDDSYTIIANPYIKDLHKAVQFFRDASASSTNPNQQEYRPLLMASFAIDYWLGHGLNPVWFHVTSFTWYLVQLVLMFVLFRRVFDASLPDPRNAWVALFATALYGLHPAMAETVNYIWQRADLCSTLAVIAGLVAYITAPRLRRYGLYLLPVAAGLLIKQPAAVFPFLLFSWIWLYEEENFWRALVRSLPAFLVTGALAVFVLKMGAGKAEGYGDPFNFRMSQPAVLLTYVRRFFLPLDLSADTDRRAYTSLLDVNVVLGFAFILAACGVIAWARRSRQNRPIAYGLVWFIVTSLPTSIFAVGELENDHRLYFPFVGLAMGLCWAAALWLHRNPLPRPAVASACALILASAAWGAHQRNAVWRNDESLWLDVSKKSPTNGRGLMNYGLSQMAVGRYTVALDYFTRALVYNPNYPTLEINLGLVNGVLHRNAEAETHYVRAITLEPKNVPAKVYYAKWLDKTGRTAQALVNLKLAVGLQPDFVDPRYLLMEIYARLGDRENLKAQAEQTLAYFPTDETAKKWLEKASTVAAAPAKAPLVASGPQKPTAADYVNQSMRLDLAGKHTEAVAAAKAALQINPGDAQAWNNLMASYNALSEWDHAIEAGRMATSLDPGSALARNNLAFAVAQKKKAEAALGH